MNVVFCIVQHISPQDLRTPPLVLLSLLRATEPFGVQPTKTHRRSATLGYVHSPLKKVRKCLKKKMVKELSPKPAPPPPPIGTFRTTNVTICLKQRNLKT